MAQQHPKAVRLRQQLTLKETTLIDWAWFICLHHHS